MKKKLLAVFIAAAMTIQPYYMADAAEFSDNIDVESNIETSDETTEMQDAPDIEEMPDEENIQSEVSENDVSSDIEVAVESEDPEEAGDSDFEEDTTDEDMLTAVDAGNYEDGIYAGNLEQVSWPQSDTEQFIFVIDGCKYNITDNVDLMVEHYVGKQVVYTLADGKIDNIEPVSELLQPSVSVNAAPDAFIYQNGGYNTDKITATVNISCRYQSYSQFFGASKYTKEELEKTDGISIPVKQVDLKIGDHLNFGTTGMILKKEITEVSEKQISLSMKTPMSYKYDIYVEKNYVPAETTVKSILSATLVKEDDTTVKCKDAVISIGNQDQQQKQLVTKNSNTDKKKAYTEMQKKLMNCTAIALDARLDEYFSKEQIDEMERFVAVYVAEVINADQMEDPNFFQQVADNLRKKVRDSILKKLHVSYSSFLFYKSSDIVINMEAETKNDGTAKIKFDIPISSYCAGDESPFASMAPINYSVLAGTSSLVSGTGVITYADMKAFANTMLDYLQIAYDKAWGEDANKIASMFVQEPINTLMDGDYSGKIYKLARKAATGEKTDVKSEAAKQTSNFIYRYVKKAIIHCPVNVYVYDESDNLCASVVDDEITSDSNEILLVVNGDEKYVYLTKDTYKIRLEGTDHGTMKYSVQEYQDGNCIRTVDTANISLEKGTEYTAIIPAVPRIDSSLYRLKDQSNTEIIETSDTYDDSDEDEEEIPSRPIESSGVCGESARWVLYEDGEMVIYGTGSISNGGWDSYKLKIKKVQVTKGITDIGAFAFRNCLEVKQIVLPDGLKNIGNGAFYECVCLQSITLPDTITEIGEYAFDECCSLENIMLPRGVTKINRGTFRECNSFEYIVIPDTVTEIESYAFEDCKRLKAIKLSSQLKHILSDSFSGCSSLENIVIPEGVTVLCANTFRDCVSLKEIQLSSKLKAIYERCFSGCNSLQSLIISEGVEEIRQEAFANCKWLKSIVIPNTVTQIGNDVFKQCNDLTIYGYSGSYAESYAKENSIPFVDMNEKKDNTDLVPIPTVTPTSTPQNPSGGTSVQKEPAVLKLNVSTVTLQRKQSTTGLKITDIAKWDSVASWKSSNTKIVKVSKAGKLTAQNKTGKATVTVTLKSGLSRKITVKVQKNAVATTSLKVLNKTTGKAIAKKITLKRKEKLNLSTVVAPITSRQKVTYTSSKKSVVTVNSKGVVTAKKKGKATITVKSGKKTVKIQITVK